MSNAKWLKLFKLFWDPDLNIQWIILKLTHWSESRLVARLFLDWPGARWGLDSQRGPFEYVDIEFIEIPAKYDEKHHALIAGPIVHQNIHALLAKMEKIGKFEYEISPDKLIIFAPKRPA